MPKFTSHLAFFYLVNFFKLNNLASLTSLFLRSLVFLLMVLFFYLRVKLGALIINNGMWSPKSP